MAYDIRHYIHCLQHDHFWVKRIQNDINKLLVNREYIDFFIRIYAKWRTYNRMKCLPHFEKMLLSQFKVYIEAEKQLNVLCATTITWVFSSFNIYLELWQFHFLKMWQTFHAVISPPFFIYSNEEVNVFTVDK